MSIEKPDHRTLPRQKRPPSPRDQAIYLARQTLGRSQQELACEHRLSQSRISQILRRVEKWRAGDGPREQGELDHGERQRVERWLARARSQAIYDRAIRAFDAAPKELKAVKSGERDGKKFHEETCREQPANAQLLRLALRASEDLAKAGDKPAPPPPRDPAAEAARQQREAVNWLYLQRQRAEQEGRVAKANSDQGDNFTCLTIVERWLDVLVGEQPQPVEPIHLTPNSPLAELAQAICPVARDSDAGSRDGIAGYDAGTGDGIEGYGAGTGEGNAGYGSSNPSNAFNPAAAETSQGPAAAAVASDEPPEENPPAYDLHSRDGIAGYDVHGIAGYDLHAELRCLEANPHVPEAVRRRARWRLNEKLAEAQREAEAFERRRLHQEKLAAWREAQRRGLPIQFVFDPADGPLPRW